LARALHARLHDPWPCAGHHHPATFSHQTAELARGLVLAIVAAHSRRAKDRHLAQVAIATEDVEGVAHFLQRRIGYLAIEARDWLAGQPHRGCQHLEGQVAVRHVKLLDHFTETAIELGAPATIGPARGSARRFSQCEEMIALATKLRTAASSAVAGIVSSHAKTMLRATPHRTADRRLVAPVPMTAPEMT